MNGSNSFHSVKEDIGGISLDIKNLSQFAGNIWQSAFAPRVWFGLVDFIYLFIFFWFISLRWLFNAKVIPIEGQQWH